MRYLFFLKIKLNFGGTLIGLTKKKILEKIFFSYQYPIFMIWNEYKFVLLKKMVGDYDDQNVENLPNNVMLGYKVHGM